MAARALDALEDHKVSTYPRGQRSRGLIEIKKTSIAGSHCAGSRCFRGVCGVNVSARPMGAHIIFARAARARNRRWPGSRRAWIIAENLVISLTWRRGPKISFISPLVLGSPLRHIDVYPLLERTQ